MPTDLSQLRVVRVGHPLAHGWFRRLVDRVREALEPTVRSVEWVEQEPLGLDRIQASFLTATLNERIGGHVLAVTDADLVDELGTDDFFPYMFGGKDERNQVAVVSTRRLGHDGPRVALERTLKVALHEIGHNFGLVHHYSFVRAPGGAYCPMSKGDYNRYGEHAYVRAVIDARGTCFCGDCQTFMRRVGCASTMWH